MRYNYLSNKDFLKIIDNLPNKTQYVKITVLSMAEDPIAAIEGYATSGSVSINGSSAVRRTGSVAMIADDSFYNILEVENLISINKRIMLEVGIENTTPYYRNENIIWFPLGVFVIGNASISRNNQGLNISLSLKDKMALLSGDVSGTLPTAMVHSPISVELEDGTYAEEPVLFKDIIRTLVHEYGGVPLDKIVIDDIEERVKNAVRWVANYPIWLDQIGEINNGEKDKNGEDIKVPMYALTTQQPTGSYDWETFEFGDNIGYINTDFVYPTESELSSNAGDSITSVLDKIKNTLGNYEYFFDLDGVFHFQAIKNYINEGSPEDNIEKAIAGAGMDYLINTQEKSVYNFDDNVLITAFQNSPQYSAIKNDINVWGIRGDSKAAIHYHLVIDDKPRVDESKTWNVVFYTDDFGVRRARKPKIGEVPVSIGTINEFYPSNDNLEEAIGIKPNILASPRGDYGSEDKTHISQGLHFDLQENGSIKIYGKRNVAEGLSPYVSLLHEDDLSEGVLKNTQYRFYCVPDGTYDYKVQVNLLGIQKDSSNNFVYLNNTNGYYNLEEEFVIRGNKYYNKNNIKLIPRILVLPADDGSIEIPEDNPIIVKPIMLECVDIDWRSEVYFDYITRENDFNINAYAKEIEEGWPKIYDIENNYFYVEAAAGTIDDGSVKRLLNNMPYFLDIIDPVTETGEHVLEDLKVSKIGRRTKVLNDNNVNSLFNPSFPNYVYIEAGQGEATKEGRAEALTKKQAFLQVPGSIYKTLAIGSAINSAYDAMRSVIHEMTSYNESISVTSLPIYHLEPNTRITIDDEKSSIHGDYMIKSFSLPLAYNGTMTLQCTKAIERI